MSEHTTRRERFAATLPRRHRPGEGRDGAMKLLRRWVKRLYELYDLADLQVGAHCGCCGQWMPNEIAPVYWAWSLCLRCIAQAEGETA